jgi:hypothetical protein
MQLVERHRVLQERPVEGGLVVNVRHLGELRRVRGRSCAVRRSIQTQKFKHKEMETDWHVHRVTWGPDLLTS